MASHGMADQVYDSMYMERAKYHDANSPWDTESMDEATDVAFAAATHPHEAPDLWVPSEVLAPLFDQAAGHAVDPGTIDTGQAMLGFAVWGVGEMAGVPETVAAYHQQFPWACGHQLDPLVPGTPAGEAVVVTEYWRRLWERLAGDDGLGDPLLAFFPLYERNEIATSADSADSVVSLVMKRGLDPGSVTPETVTVYDAADEEHPVDLSVFYGEASHVINIRPQTDWIAGQEYEIFVLPELRTYEGEEYGIWMWISFVPGSLEQELPADEPDGCTCQATPGAAAPWSTLLLSLLGGLAVGRRLRSQGSTPTSPSSRPPGRPRR